MHQFLSIAQQAFSESSLTHLPEWLAAALIAYQAGTLTRKQKRKLKWKLAWEIMKNKLSFSKKAKKEGKKTGLKIIVVVLILACFGFAIWLGIIKQLLILLGATILFYLLFITAAKKQGQ